MTTIPWPADILPTQIEFWLQPNAVITTSIARTTQVLVRSPPRWMAAMRFDDVTPEDAARIDALIAEVNGPSGEIMLWDFRRPAPAKGEPMGWGGGTVGTTWSSGTTWSNGTSWASVTPPLAPQLQDAATAGSQWIETWGWAANDAPLTRGDYIAIAGQLYMVVNAGVSSAIGALRLGIRPALRKDLVAGELLITSRASARFRLMSNDEGKNTTRGPAFSSYAIALVESLVAIEVPSDGILLDDGGSALLDENYLEIEE